MSVWQPIATWPTTRADPAYFWVVPKTADEAYVDSAGRPIVSTAAHRLFLGRYNTWSAMEKATHWMEAPTPSRPEVGTAGGTMGEQRTYDVNDTTRAIEAVMESLRAWQSAFANPRVKAILLTKLEEAALWSLKLVDDRPPGVRRG